MPLTQVYTRRPSSVFVLFTHHHHRLLVVSSQSPPPLPPPTTSVLRVARPLIPGSPAASLLIPTRLLTLVTAPPPHPVIVSSLRAVLVSLLCLYFLSGHPHHDWTNVARFPVLVSASFPAAPWTLILSSYISPPRSLSFSSSFHPLLPSPSLSLFTWSSSSLLALVPSPPPPPSP